MINLFESFDIRTQRLYKTFENAKMNVQTIVIEEDGFLPSNVITPYQFFANNDNHASKPLFFNQVPLPRFWEIEGNNNSAEIKNMGEVKGRIIYKKNYGLRIVERIEWLNKQGRTQVIDYYNNKGLKYAQLMVDDNQRRIIKRWFNDRNEEIISENFVTNDIMLKWNDKEYIFQSKVQFVIFYLKMSEMPLESFLINSLSIPFAVLHDLKVEGHDYLYWQEQMKDDLPGNMKLMLADKTRGIKILIPNNEEYDKVRELVESEHQSRSAKAGYVYEFKNNHKEARYVLTLTNSDQIPHIEDIVKTHPQYQFHIVAITEMSQKLLQLNKYHNVTLHPVATKEKIHTLYETCDIYLDINKGNEILDAIKVAFEHQLLILGYKETVHNADYIAKENQFSLEHKDQLIHALKEIEAEPTLADVKRESQLKHASSIQAQAFEALFQ